MALDIVKTTLRQTNLPHESADYLEKREELRLAELELMRQREKVAALRRALPQGATVQDYTFEEGPADLNAGDNPIRTVRLSELFSAPGARHPPARPPRGTPRRSDRWRQSNPHRPLERTLLRPRPRADGLSLDVRKTPSQALPDVHRPDRRLQRQRCPSRAER